MVAGKKALSLLKKDILRKCAHSKVELLGEQKGERRANKYYKCLECGNVLVLSEDGILYEVRGVDATSLKENRSKTTKRAVKCTKAREANTSKLF